MPFGSMRFLKRTHLGRWVFLLGSILLIGCSSQPVSLVGVPVSPAAIQTRDFLNTAAHNPQNRFGDAVSIRGIDPAQFTIPPFTATQVGDQHEFYVNFDFDKDFRLVPATLRYVSENGAWWVADNAIVTDDDLRAAADTFENSALQVNRQNYGHEPQPGVDGYDHINFLFVNIPEWGEYYGYFSVVNQLPTVLKPFSNQTEMLILNTGGAPLGSPVFNSQLAHEFGHLIHWSVDPNEDLWMNEAFAEMSALLAESHPAGSLLDGGNQQVYVHYPFLQLNMRPDGTAPEFDRNVVFAHYGMEKLFMAYLLDRFGLDFVHGLIANPEPGLRALDQELGKLNPPLTFNQVYPDWILANLMNQPDHPQGRFGYENIQVLKPATTLRDTFTGEKSIGYLPPYSVFYYELQAKENVRVDFRGAAMARLTPVEPYDGQYAWYSNRGDETSFTLTRTFDLTGVHAATLNYRLWYNLEKDYDYGYVLASVDDGKRWDVLPTKYSVVENLGEDAFGMAYTGTSGGWRRESLDLSHYAGKKVSIRFVVNTDLATNLEGMLLDNIAIPEINFFDGAESDQGGWDAQGFIRSANIVPVEWVVWVVKIHQNPGKVDEVVRITLDELQSGSFEIARFGEDFDDAVMVIAPVASTTTMGIDYELTLTGQ